MLSSGDNWDTIPRTSILVLREKLLEDALREVRKERFDPTKLLRVMVVCLFLFFVYVCNKSPICVSH